MSNIKLDAEDVLAAVAAVASCVGRDCTGKMWKALEESYMKRAMAAQDEAYTRQKVVLAELLAAAQEMMRYAPGEYFNDDRPQGEIDGGNEAAFRELRTAIARATGEQP